MLLMVQYVLDSGPCRKRLIATKPPWLGTAVPFRHLDRPSVLEIMVDDSSRAGSKLDNDEIVLGYRSSTVYILDRPIIVRNDV